MTFCTNDAILINYEYSWIRMNLPGCGNRPSQTISPGVPIDVIAFHYVRQGIWIISTNADQLEWFVFISFNERPLVVVHETTGPSPVTGEVEQYYLAFVIAQLGSGAVLKHADDFRRTLPHTGSGPEQIKFGDYRTGGKKTDEYKDLLRKWYFLLNDSLLFSHGSPKHVQDMP